jgi:hypothetical protein
LTSADSAEATHRWVEAEHLRGGCLTLQLVSSPARQSGWTSDKGVDALVGKQDRVAGGLGELLDPKRPQRLNCDEWCT